MIDNKQMKFLSLTITKFLLLGTLFLFSSASDNHDHSAHADDADDHDHHHDELWNGHFQLSSNVYTLNLQRAGKVCQYDFFDIIMLSLTCLTSGVYRRLPQDCNLQTCDQ